MDQIKIGEFLKELRKEKRLTQEHPRLEPNWFACFNGIFFVGCHRSV